MSAKDFAIVAGIATATLVGTLAVVGPTGVDAGRGKRRAIRAKGVEMSLRTTRTTRRPTAQLTLVNTTNDTVQLNPRIALYTEARGSEFSRMVQPPRQRWSDEPLLVLEPGETKTVEIDPDQKIPRRSLAWFTVSAGKRQLNTNNFVARSPRNGKLAKKSSKKPTKASKAPMKQAANRNAKRPMPARQAQMAMF